MLVETIEHNQLLVGIDFIRKVTENALVRVLSALRVIKPFPSEKKEKNIVLSDDVINDTCKFLTFACEPERGIVRRDDGGKVKITHLGMVRHGGKKSG